jgi:hypothetical protein
LTLPGLVCGPGEIFSQTVDAVKAEPPLSAGTPLPAFA